MISCLFVIFFCCLRKIYVNCNNVSEIKKKNIYICYTLRTKRSKILGLDQLEVKMFLYFSQFYPIEGEP